MRNKFLRLFKFIGVFLLVTVLSWGLSYTQIMQRLDNLWIDTEISLATPIQVNDVAIIAIDANSLAEYGYWPWSRGIHGQLVEKLTEIQAAPIVFDILFSDVNQYDREGDAAFVKAIKKHGQVVLAMSEEVDSQTGTVNTFLPIPALLSAAASIGHSDIHTGHDGIARGIYLNLGQQVSRWPALSSAAIYVKEQYVLPLSERRQGVTLTSSISVLFGVQEILFPFQQLDIPVYSYKDVMSGTVTTELSGKTVFVGMDAVGLGRLFTTPLGVMNGVEFQANVFYSLVHNQQRVDTLQWRYWIGYLMLILGGLLCVRLSASYYHALGLILMTLFVIAFSNALLGMQIALPAVSVWLSLVIVFMIHIGRRLTYLAHIAQRDVLTGLYNRRQFDLDFERLWQKNQRENDAISLILIDIDFFKKINDSFGHAQGDVVLAAVAQVLEDKTRRSKEKVYRIGGEEFAILRQGDDEETIVRYAQSIVKDVENNVPDKLPDMISSPVTVSAGCAHFDSVPHLSKQHLYEQADKALYEAKEAGRNRAVFIRH